MFRLSVSAAAFFATLTGCQDGPPTENISQASVPSLENCEAQGEQNTQNCRAVVRVWQDGFEAGAAEMAKFEDVSEYRQQFRGSPYDDGTPKPGFDEFIARCVSEGAYSLEEVPLAQLYAFFNRNVAERNNRCARFISNPSITDANTPRTPQEALENSVLAQDSPSSAEAEE